MTGQILFKILNVKHGFVKEFCLCSLGVQGLDAKAPQNKVNSKYNTN